MRTKSLSAAFALLLLVMAAPVRSQSAAKVNATSADPVTREQMLEEIQIKMGRVEKFLEHENLGGVVITQVRNFSWITAGIADNHIVITSEVGAVSLVILRGGKKYVVATNSEIPRMMAEDLKGLGYEAREYKWYENREGAILRELAAGKPLGTDVPKEGLQNVDLAPLRFELTDSEIAKYRWLGRNSTEAVIATIHRIHPGMTEREIEAVTSEELMRRGIRPTVLLIGVDDRLYHFRHAVPSARKLERYAMVNICSRRWGLVIAVTRFVHFGPIPEDLRKRLQVVANVNAHYYAATVPGATAGDILEQAKKWYADAGYPGEWENHHQGGAIGYGERDWVATPGSTQTVHARQAFAWNPTVAGAKIEDTIVAWEDHIENLTATPGWPVVNAEVGGKKYPAPAILELPAAGGKRATKEKPSKQ
jgi:Xaa-Pro dipeptidase